MGSYLLTFLLILDTPKNVVCNTLSLQSSDELKRKLKIQTFGRISGGSFTKNSKGRFITSSQGQETVNVYDEIGPDFQVFLHESEIVW